MDKQMKSYPYNGMLLSNLKEWTVDTHNVGGIQNYYAEFPGKKENILHDSIYIKFHKMQN